MEDGGFERFFGRVPAEVGVLTLTMSLGGVDGARGSCGLVVKNGAGVPTVVGYVVHSALRLEDGAGVRDDIFHRMRVFRARRSLRDLVARGEL